MAKIREILARNLKENRHRLGLTQAELAEKADISTNFIAMIELKRKFPAPDMMDRIAAALDIETQELFTTPASPENTLQKLYNAILGDLDQAIGDAVDKAIDKRWKELHPCKGQK